MILIVFLVPTMALAPGQSSVWPSLMAEKEPMGPPAWLALSKPMTRKP